MGGVGNVLGGSCVCGRWKVGLGVGRMGGEGWVYINYMFIIMKTGRGIMWLRIGAITDGKL